MTKWIVLAATMCGLAIVLFVGRRAFKRHFFWQRVIVVWAIILMIVVTALLPIGVKTNTTSASNLDIIFAVDITPSANAVDGRGGNETTRLQNMRDDMHKIVGENIGASVSITTFSDQVSQYLPLTTGSNDISNAIDTIYTADQFQAIQKIASYTTVFKSLSDYVGQQQKHDPTRQRIVVFMSDFEIYNNQDTIDQAVSAAGGLQDHGAGYVGLLYGQDAGAKMLNMAYDYENSEHVPSYKLYGDDEFTKYLQNNYKSVTSVPNVELASSISKRMNTSLVKTVQSQDFEPVLQKAANQSARLAERSPQTQALHQNVFYIAPAVMLFAWLCIAEFIKPRWLNLRLRRNGATQGQTTSKEPGL